MDIFGKSGGDIAVWGATASVDVQISAIPDAESTWVLADVRVGAQEIVDVRKCFNDESYVYALGNDQGRCQIVLTFAIFCGTCRSGAGEGRSMEAVGSGLESYKTHRISQKTTPSEITIGGFSTKGWLLSVDVGQMDASTMTCRGVVSFMMDLEATGKK